MGGKPTHSVTGPQIRHTLTRASFAVFHS